MNVLTPQGQTRAPIDQRAIKSGESKWVAVPRTLCKFSFGISIAQMVLVIGIIVYRYYGEIFVNHVLDNGVAGVENKTSGVVHRPDTMCVPCDYLGPSVTTEDTLYDSITTTRCGHRICCVKDKQYLYRLVVRVRYTLDLHYTLYASRPRRSVVSRTGNTCIDWSSG